MATRPLMTTLWHSDDEQGSVYYFTHDLMKNVRALVDDLGECVASYTYEPFGALLEAKGSCSDVNKFRFSSEYMDDELGLIYYNYRHTNPWDGRWINRDPIFERGGINLYGFVENKSFMIDNLGRSLGFADYYCNDAAFAFGNAIQEMKSQFYDCPQGARLRWNTDGGTLLATLEYRTKISNGEKPKANGCGSEGGDSYPNAFPGFDFGAACDAHDICYGTCGSDKATCDSQFLEDMDSECKKIQVSPGAPNHRDMCYALAEIYAFAVREKGGDPYECAQDKACEWKTCPCKKSE